MGRTEVEELPYFFPTQKLDLCSFLPLLTYPPSSIHLQVFPIVRFRQHVLETGQSSIQCARFDASSFAHCDILFDVASFDFTDVLLAKIGLQMIHTISVAEVNRRLLLDLRPIPQILISKNIKWPRCVLLLPSHFTSKRIGLTRQAPLLGQAEPMDRLLLADLPTGLRVRIINLGNVALSTGPATDAGLHAVSFLLAITQPSFLFVHPCRREGSPG